MTLPQYVQRAALALGIEAGQVEKYRQEGDQVVILVNRGIGGITKHTLAAADLPPLADSRPPLPRPEPPKPPPKAEPEPAAEPGPDSEPKTTVTKRPAKRQL